MHKRWRAAVLVAFSFFAGAATLSAYHRLHHETVSYDLTIPVKGAGDFRHLYFMRWAQTHHADVLLLGNSIVDFWRDVPDMFSSDFPNSADFGSGGDRIENVLWRVEHGEIEAVHPRVVVLLIGANNLGNCSNEQIVTGISHLIARIHAHAPEAKVLLIGLLPTDIYFAGPGAMERVKEINRQLASIQRVSFLDIGPKLLKPDGSIDPQKQADHLHLSPTGYQVWAEAMKPIIQSMLGEPTTQSTW